MGRLSYLRKSPEGWQASIRRMVSLHGVELEPEAAREIVRYLATAQGLAPEELRPGLFEVENRMVPFQYSDRPTEETCSACHSMGRVITARRTPEEWQLLVATHRALYPLVDRQAFYDTGGPGALEDTAETAGHPVERAVEHLSEAFPLHTPEWQAWSANLRPPRIEGTWALSGYEPGRGEVFGTVEVRSTTGQPDEFTTTASYVYPRDGGSVSRSGAGLVYTGYQWRGRSRGSGPAAELREVMMLDRGWAEMTGRWFTGPHDEFGIDVTLRRVGNGPTISGIHPAALRAGAGVQEVHIYGANLPVDLRAGGVDLGPGITVREVVSASPTRATLRVEVAGEARPGRRDFFLGGASLAEAVVVFDRIDRIEVSPELGLARVGGIVVPKQFQQFEAIAFHDGADGEAGTADDLELGAVPVEWSLEEFPVTYEDDDVQFVGHIDARGLFTPNEDGPNPARSRNRNNIGEVWVAATYRDPSQGERPLHGRAYLIVTAPLHIRWEAQEMP